MCCIAVYRGCKLLTAVFSTVSLSIWRPLTAPNLHSRSAMAANIAWFCPRIRLISTDYRFEDRILICARKLDWFASFLQRFWAILRSVARRKAEFVSTQNGRQRPRWDFNARLCWRTGTFVFTIRQFLNPRTRSGGVVYVCMGVWEGRFGRTRVWWFGTGNAVRGLGLCMA